MGGQIQIGFDDLPSSINHIRAGKIRALAVTTAKRWPGAPEIPTLAEAGIPGYEVSAWFGLLAPAATPRPVIELLQRHVAAILRLPEVETAIRCAGKARRRRALRFAWAERGGPLARKTEPGLKQFSGLFMPGEGQGLCALAEQRGQRAEVRLNRVCSALTRVVKAFVGKEPSKVNVLQAGSGQLRFLG